MTNLLIKKVMDNMARQYRKENGISDSMPTMNEISGNISKAEEALLVNIIKNKEESSAMKSCTGQKVSLGELAMYKEKDSERKKNAPSKISLGELAKKQCKTN